MTVLVINLSPKYLIYYYLINMYIVYYILFDLYFINDFVNIFLSALKNNRQAIVRIEMYLFI